MLGQVVAEKSLTKKKLTHKHTHTEKAQTYYIPPIYFIYRGITIIDADNKALSFIIIVQFQICDLKKPHQLPRLSPLQTRDVTGQKLQNFTTSVAENSG